MGVKVKVYGDFNKTDAYLNKASNISDYAKVKEIAKNGANKLSIASMRSNADQSVIFGWDYEIDYTPKGWRIIYTNSANQNGNNIVAIVDNGHATRDGRWVSGKKFLGKTTKEIYNDILDNTWEELHKL